MNRVGQELWAVARLDFSDVLRSRWMAFCVTVYAVLGAAFVFVGMRESMVIGFSGMGRVLMSMVHTLLLVLPLLALTATGQVINRARDDGTLELLFSHPVRRGVFFLAVTMTRYVVLAAPLVVVLLGLSLLGWLGFDQPVNWPFVIKAITVSASLVAAYVGLGLTVSTLVRNQARAVIWILLLWAMGAALLDFGLVAVMLQWRLNPQAIFLIAALNPVQAARMALLAGASTELSVLGPVGFYLTNSLGPATLYTLGVVWPALLGLTVWLVALRNFRRADLV